MGYIHNYFSLIFQNLFTDNAAKSTITGTKLDRLGAKLDKQVAVADLVLSSFLFKLTSTNYLDSCRRYVLLSNLVTGMVRILRGWGEGGGKMMPLTSESDCTLTLYPPQS